MILGFSEGFHDAAAALINEDTGKIEFASHSERFSRKKNDRFIGSGLAGHIQDKYGDEIRHVAFYEKPFLKKTRQITSGQWKTVSTPRKPAWKPDSFWHHHKSHAAAAFQTSNHDRAMAVVVDSVGEWDTASIWKCWYSSAGRARYKKLWRWRYPMSLGLWYSALTDYAGLRPNEEEYAFMGMAAYGTDHQTLRNRLSEFLYNENNHRGIPPGSFHPYYEVDLARSAQLVLEEALKNIFVNAKLLWEEHFGSGDPKFAYGGGVALNCAANAVLQTCFGPNGRDLWIFPNPGDAGAALGAAALAYGKRIEWEHPYLGFDIPASKDVLELADDVVDELVGNGVCGIANGRAEFGPRALGNRSLLADPRRDNMKNKINRIKKRQKFRPFAPVVLEGLVDKHFKDVVSPSPHMSYLFKAKDRTVREFPSIVHKDGTSRIQTVSTETFSIIFLILKKWHERTGCSMLLNTSLNIRGEPMVNDVSHARGFEKKYEVKVVF